ncbi:MAG: 16S rRNA (cytosine(1402)-N(4))-methyltransferase RsmH [Bacteroidia bacterium]|jgi:16S rRNA (cytosine1402-N4)-methyltransferase
MAEYHVPVMLQECLDGLNINPDGIYVDVTFGGGGHSRAILERLSAKGKLVAFDQDEDARKNLPADKRLIFIDQNFRFLSNHLQYQGLVPVDGLLADLGVSSHQFDIDERGFSFRFDEAELDMRMNRTQEISAASVLNTYNESRLADIFYLFGELKNSRQLAKAIVISRNAQPIKTVGELKQAIGKFAPKFKDYKFYAQVFQALRIEVNHEIDVLKQLLLQTPDLFKAEGRLVVMSYHSLEDRLVKNFMQTGNLEGVTQKDFYGNILRPFDPIGKTTVAGDVELESNNRGRSAKLRIATRRKENSPN